MSIQEFPKHIYKDGQRKLVQNAAEERAAGEGYSESPAEEAAKPAEPAKEPKPAKKLEGNGKKADEAKKSDGGAQ
jgi:hypothetical protein